MRAICRFAFLSAAVLFASGACRADLLEAAKQGDAAAVRAFLAKEKRPDVRDRHKLTPLHWAAQGGHTEVIRLLLAAGADVNAEDRYGSHPLYYSVVYSVVGDSPIGGHAAAVKLLLEKGARVDAINGTWSGVSAGDLCFCTALDVASERGRVDLVALLLDYGADVSSPLSPVTPLLAAVSHGHIEVARLLLDHGADVNMRVSRPAFRPGEEWGGFTLLHRADNPKMLKLLLDRGGDKDARDDKGHTPLHVGAVMGWLEAIKILLDHGADVNARDSDGWTALHYAAMGSRKGKYFCLDLTRMLLRYGADPGARDREGNTPLHLGARGQTGLAAARLLLEARPDLEVRNDEGDTLLHTAAALGCSEWALVLLEKGADPRATNKRDETPLHLAARSGLRDVAQRLLDRGVSVSDTNVDGDTPLHLAAGSRAWRWAPNGPPTPTLYRNFPDAGMSFYDIRDWYADSPPAGTVECLLRRGADVNAVNKAGDTALHCALALQLDGGMEPGYPLDTRRLTKELRALLAAGADVDAADANGDTPLHLAAAIGVPEVLQTLLERGAKADARNHAGDTLLHAVAAARGYAEVRVPGLNPSVLRRRLDLVQCVRLLIQSGVDVNARNNKGDTPLHVAVAVGGVPNVVRALLDEHADIGARNNRGQTPLQLAISAKRDTLVGILRARGAK